MPETQTHMEPAAAPPELSPKRLAANRRNARRSTGPRTPRGKSRSRMNAFKHGAHSLPPRLMAPEKECAEYEDLLNDLMAAHQPSNAGERLLVEDLAGLRWQRRRAERAQAALQAQALEALEFERRRRALTLRERYDAVPYQVTAQVGLVQFPDSPGKFSRIITVLETLRDAVRLRQIPSGLDDLAQSIYGMAPSERGARIIAGLKKMAEPSSSQQPGAAGHDTLEMALNQDLRAAQESFELYKAEHVAISPAAADACLAPKGPEWRTLLRLMSILERNIERKTRLLLHIQGLRRPRQKRPRKASCDKKARKIKQSFFAERSH